MNTRNKIALFFSLAILIALTGCGSKASSGGEASPAAAKAAKDVSGDKKLKEVTVATSSSGIAYGAIYLAQEENIWEKYGLKVNLISMDSSGIPAAVISGDVPIVNGSGSGIINAAIKTRDKVKVSGTLGTVPFMLYAGKNIKKLEDLKGKIIGVAPGSSTEYAAITMLKSVGLTLGKDVSPLQVIGGDTLLSISQGKIDAGFIVPPMSVQADKMGLNHLLNLQDIKGIKGLYMIGGVNAAYAEKNPDVITNYYKAYHEAVLLSRKEKEKTKKALSKWTKVEDEEALEFAYNYFVNFWPTDSHIPNDEIQFILDQLAATTNPEAKNVKLESIVDYKYIDAIK